MPYQLTLTFDSLAELHSAVGNLAFLEGSGLEPSGSVYTDGEPTRELTPAQGILRGEVEPGTEQPDAVDLITVKKAAVALRDELGSDELKSRLEELDHPRVSAIPEEDFARAYNVFTRRA